MFGLADVNSFYASCEALFRPDLRGKPVVVLSNNDGCVIARSAGYVEFQYWFIYLVSQHLLTY
ncbi:DNA repair protein [Pantoea rodasii]|uniref:DNA repair protein n=1 Tax=Pantoea rodasii TaxID=1076549 RepID=A0A2M9WI18_9GAMM|nr:DNA repair protein [Pantoea rodasii]PJZ07167.1 DNA repair protein [Pantoea rodasii]